MSVIGSAPRGANKTDYYLPMLAAYSRWCLLMAEGRSDRAPLRCFVTYSTNDLALHLGATIGGAKKLKSVIQVARFKWMSTVGGLNLGSNPQISTIRKVEDGEGQLFGHCSESLALSVAVRCVPTTMLPERFS